MTRLRRLGAVLALVASVALVVSATGYSTVAADRTVTVNAVGDDTAFVGVQSCYVPSDPEQRIQKDKYSQTDVAVEVTNRFAEQLGVEITANRNSNEPQGTVAASATKQFTVTADGVPETVYVNGSTTNTTITEISAAISQRENCPFTIN
jgi:uncharacterized protein (UPF0210 family)